MYSLLKNVYSTIIKPAVLAAYQIMNLKKGSNLLDDPKINIAGCPRVLEILEILEMSGIYFCPGICPGNHYLSWKFPEMF